MFWKAFSEDKLTNKSTITRDQRLYSNSTKDRDFGLTDEWWNKYDPFPMNYGQMARCMSENTGICKSMTQGWCKTGCRTTRGYRRNARREERISPESHQEEGEPKPENGATGTLTTDDNNEYWTCRRQVSVKPARFDDFVMD